MKKILIIDHFSQPPNEPGNNRFIYLAKLLCEKNYEIEIVTTDFSHKNKKTRDKYIPGIEKLSYKYTMLPEPGYTKNVCIKRFYSHYIFGKNLAKYLTTITKPDLVYIAIPSLDVGRIARKYCKKNGIPFFVDIQDLWPEAFKLVLNIRIISDVIFFPLIIAENRIFEAADEIIAVSDTYLKRGLKNNLKNNGLVVYLGTDLKEFDNTYNNSHVIKKDDEIWLVYVGTLGHSYNIKIVIDAISKLVLSGFNNIKFKVLGDGPLLEEFKNYSKLKKVDVDFLGRKDYKEMITYLANADIAVNPISKGAAQSIINKHSDYAASGLPVVSTQENYEYRNLIDNYTCGFNCNVEDTAQVAEAIKKLVLDENLRNKMKIGSRKMAEELFDRNSSNARIINLIESYLETE
ncbi:glycosyltransferase family 4 protein [Thomasclavelia cocleata]|uniref:glycosyltransferase family 4 protein n=1 Tax=Thomasclavelia cocleata TaxID=69824 RepID=UPI002430D591|nr:glycosyltransferase family 4 protein [Thomasclavelia cocleata]